jgi:thioredoxin 1
MDSPTFMKGGRKMANANVLDLTTANWEAEVAKSDKPVLVDFWAAWCGPCRMLTPTINVLADQFAGKVKVAKVDIDQNQEIAIKYGINTIPQVLLFKGGENVVDKKIGVHPEAEFVKMINRALEA